MSWTMHVGRFYTSYEESVAPSLPGKLSCLTFYLIASNNAHESYVLSCPASSTMSYPSVDEFKDILLSRPLDGVVQEYLFQGMPYVFRDRPESLKLLRRHLCDALKLSDQNVIVVGSAQIGFSLSPDNFPRQFSDESDIDIVVVDEALFDKVWMTMLKWHYPRRLSHLGQVDGEWASARRRDLYWGWFVPDKIRFEGLSLPHVLNPLRDISTEWFNAFQSLSQYPQFASRSISGRLYRTWDHALLYHLDGLRQISDAIRVTKKGV